MRNARAFGLLITLSLGGCTNELGGAPADPDIGAGALSYGDGASQFGGGFAPSNAPWGGFGGGDCVATRTPVVFIHGNGVTAEQWDFPPVDGSVGVYDELRADGYNDCELFGVNWLDPDDLDTPQFVYHDSSNRQIVSDFIDDVLDYTGASQVDVVAHSMGVTLALEAIDHEGAFGEVRRFVGIAGGMRGLTSCYSVGYANAYYPTCGSENWWDSSIFGFYPDTWYAPNDRMGNGGFRDLPSGHSTLFYTIGAGVHDQILCSAVGNTSGCQRSALFDGYSNVRAQLDIGYGSTTLTEPEAGGDADGIGHFRARNNSGKLLVNMLQTSCTGTGCCTGYSDPCVIAN